MENKKENIISNLQGIRGYAILLIFISHCNFGLNVKGINYTNWLGGFGVSLFIMLSGYLLMHNYHKRKIELKSYVIKKIKKFYPLHIVTLIMAFPFAIKQLLSFDFKAWLGLLCNILLVQSWIPNSGVYFSYNAVAWYLSITIFFIFMAPVVVKFWNSVESSVRIIAILTGLIVIDIVWCAVFNNCSNAHWLIYIFPLIRMNGYLFGGGTVESIAKEQI